MSYSKSEWRRIKALHDAGGHLVLCQDKVARKWKTRRPWAEIAKWTGRIGIVPGSVGCVVIDQDAGSGDIVYDVFGAGGHRVPSRREGGGHVWYKWAGGEDETCGNGKWYHSGVSCGEFRHLSGYCVMWHVVDLSEVVGELDVYRCMLAGVKGLPDAVRDVLLSTVGADDDRSEVLAGVVRDLKREGFDRREVARIVRGSRWNKFGANFKRLREDVRRVWALPDTRGRGLKTTYVGRKSEVEWEKGRERRQVTVPVSELKAAPVKWLWPGYIPQGRVTWLSGEGGAGKSWIALWLCAAVSCGGELPGGGRVRRGRCLILSSEEDRNVMRGKLNAVAASTGAAVDMAEIVTTPGLTNADLVDVDAMMASVGPQVVVLDPIQSFMRSMDPNAQNDARDYVNQLEGLCEKHGATIVGIRHHRKSGAEGRAAHRGLGSVDLTNAVRSELAVGWMPGNYKKRRVLMVTKSNLPTSAPLPWSFRIDPEVGFIWEKPVQITGKKMLNHDPTEDLHPQMVLLEQFEEEARSVSGGVLDRDQMVQMMEMDLDKGLESEFFRQDWELAIGLYLYLHRGDKR